MERRGSILNATKRGIARDRRSFYSAKGMVIKFCAAQIDFGVKERVYVLPLLLDVSALFTPATVIMCDALLGGFSCFLRATTMYLGWIFSL